MTDLPTDHTSADDVSMIRHEERLNVSTETFARERVRLEKYIVTEERTVTVTVRREEVRMTREPLPADAPLGDAFDQFPRVLVLSEEQVVVTTRIVPAERVWLEKHRVIEQQTMSATLSHERIDLEQE